MYSGTFNEEQASAIGLHKYTEEVAA